MILNKARNIGLIDYTTTIQHPALPPTYRIETLIGTFAPYSKAAHSHMHKLGSNYIIQVTDENADNLMINGHCRNTAMDSYNTGETSEGHRAQALFPT